MMTTMMMEMIMLRRLLTERVLRPSSVDRLFEEAGDYCVPRFMRENAHSSHPTDRSTGLIFICA